MGTPSKPIQLAHINAQLLTLQARVIRQQTRILTGAYKSRVVDCGGVRLGEDALLTDELNILDRHIHRMQDITDNIFDLDDVED